MTQKKKEYYITILISDEKITELRFGKNQKEGGSCFAVYTQETKNIKKIVDFGIKVLNEKNEL